VCKYIFFQFCFYIKSDLNRPFIACLEQQSMANFFDFSKALFFCSSLGVKSRVYCMSTAALFGCGVGDGVRSMGGVKLDDICLRCRVTNNFDIKKGNKMSFALFVGHIICK